MKFALLATVLLMLSGCASMNGQYDCPLKDNGSCRSMKETDKLISSGGLQSDKVSLPNAVKVYKHNFLADVSPQRVPDTIMRVWFAPYEDLDGNYHQEAIVYTVINNSHWRGYPPKSIQEASS